MNDGVRQEGIISQILSGSCLEGAFKKLDWEDSGIRVNEEYMSRFRFGNDVSGFSESGGDLQRTLLELYTESSIVGSVIQAKSSVKQTCRCSYAYR